MRTPGLFLLAVVLVTAGLGLLLLKGTVGKKPAGPATTTGTTSSDAGRQPSSTKLLLYCAAGIANPVTAVAKDYQEEFGVQVDIQFGGSGMLLSNLRVVRQGDLFLAADSSYLDIARQVGLVEEAIPLAQMRPVIAVRKGNPRSIRAVEDLVRPEVLLALANPEAASIGEQSKLLLTRMGKWELVEAAARERGVFKPTVNEVATDVKLGTVDAGIVWDATIRQKDYVDDLEAIELENSAAFVKEITIGVLLSAAQPARALHFARYLGAREKGLPVFARMGFTPVEGDAWADRPTILLYAGAVNRLAIQDTLLAFEQREGVEITTVFNGCGILNGQIKLGEKPDVYLTCDATFMKGVEERFLPYLTITETDMVILVAKGNPKGIRSPKDLSQAGLKLGVANEQQSTLGALTTRLLKEQGIYDAVWKNVVATTPTADLLVNQIRTGSLDAVIVYQANAVFVRQEMETIPMDLPMAKAVQSFAIGKASGNRHLVGRLFDSIRSAPSQLRFGRAGFRWLESSDKK